MGNVEGSAKFIQEFAVFLIQIILKTYTANKILNISSPVESAYVGRRPQKILLLKISPPLQTPTVAKSTMARHIISQCLQSKNSMPHCHFL